MPTQVLLNVLVQGGATSLTQTLALDQTLTPDNNSDDNANNGELTYQLSSM